MTYTNENEDGPNSPYLHDLDGGPCHYPDGSRIPLAHFGDEPSEEQEAYLALRTLAERIATIQMLGQPVPRHLLVLLQKDLGLHKPDR